MRFGSRAFKTVGEVNHYIFIWFVSLLVALQLPAMLPADAYKPGEFPGKGDYKAWLRAGVLYNAANNLEPKHDMDEAIVKYKQAIAIYGYDADYWNGLGLAYAHKHKAKEAERCYRQAISLNRDDGSTWANLANALDDQGRLKEEKNALTKALSSRFPPPPQICAEIPKAIQSIDRDLKVRAQTISK